MEYKLDVIGPTEHAQAKFTCYYNNFFNCTSTHFMLNLTVHKAGKNLRSAVIANKGNPSEM
jgi:hypothetical protein